MNVQWYLARHVSDLARGETRNVGVVLVHEDAVLTAFIGQTTSGAIDDDLLRALGLRPAYQDWVAHWQRTAADGPAAVEAAAHPDTRRENYYLELAGQILAGDAPPADRMLEDLFTRLVVPVESSR